MKTPVLVVAFMATLTCLAFARIGETESEIVKRYGKPIVSRLSEDGLPQRVYSFKGLVITVEFFNDKSSVEYYVKSSGNTFSFKEAETLLDANNGGKKWFQIGGENSQKWKSENGIMVAIFDQTKMQELAIMTTETIDRTQKKQVETLKGI